MINKIRFESFDKRTIADIEKKKLLSRLPKWINPFIDEINHKEITLIIEIQEDLSFHYYFEPIDADLSFRMQMASEK